MFKPILKHIKKTPQTTSQMQKLNVTINLSVMLIFKSKLIIIIFFFFFFCRKKEKKSEKEKLKKKR